MAAFRRTASTVLLVLAVLALPAGPGAQTPPADGVAGLIRRLEQAAGTADPAAILRLGDPAVSRPDFEDFAATVTSPAPTRTVMGERDRVPLAGGGQRVIVEIFSERGMEAQLGTWRLDVRPGQTSAEPWRVAAVTRLSVVSGLYRLSLNTAKEYDIHDLTVRAPDLALEMSSGRAFVAESPDGPTAVVLLGRGRIRFTPTDPSERTQVRIFSGAEALVTDVNMAFLRVSPEEFDTRFDSASLKPRAVDPSDLRAATAVFNDHVGRTLQVDLSDISRERWSLIPAYGDLIAEMRTRRFGTLTYARSGAEAEDITLFDRKRRRNISVYASAAKLERRGRFYSEDDRIDYDVLAYDIDAEITPDRGWIEGNVRMKVKVRANSSTSLTFRLAEQLAVRGVYSPDFGRLLHLRVVGQNALIVNLPAVLTRDSEIWLDVLYSGTLPSQSFDREAIQLAQEVQENFAPLEPRYLYSNRSY